VEQVSKGVSALSLCQVSCCTARGRDRHPATKRAQHAKDRNVRLCCGACVFYAAGEMLTCPVTVANHGNVALYNIALTAPSSACYVSWLQIDSPPATCYVSVMTSQQDIQQGFVNLTTIWTATHWRLGGYETHNWASSTPVYVQPTGRLQLQILSPRLYARSAGEPATMQLGVGALLSSSLRILLGW